MAYTLEPEDIELDMYCTKCYGAATNCEFCKGVGTVPTTFGEKVLQFIQKYSQNGGS